jgi:hypothetical protein
MAQLLLILAAVRTGEAGARARRRRCSGEAVARGTDSSVAGDGHACGKRCRGRYSVPSHLGVCCSIPVALPLTAAAVGTSYLPVAFSLAVTSADSLRCHTRATHISPSK